MLVYQRVPKLVICQVGSDFRCLRRWALLWFWTIPGRPWGATTCVVDGGGSDWPLLVPAGAMAKHCHTASYIYMYILYTYNKVYRSIILYQVGLIMFGDLGGGQVVDALWMRCSAWDGVIWISSWVGQKEILRWLTQEAAERGDHLTVIVPTNNGMGWHGEDPVPSEYLRMPRRSSQGPTMPHWPRIHKKSNRPPDVWWCWPWYTMVYPSS